MKLKNLETLEDLFVEVKALNQLIDEKTESQELLRTKPLFRGESDSSWDLETSLERYTDKAYSVWAYNVQLNFVHSSVAAFTGKDWPFEPDLTQKFSSDSFTHPPNYEFVVYARQTGFPSPLLDWTQSLYIALFFAFQKVTKADRVAIYVFIESLTAGKSSSSDDPRILVLGEYVKTHARHFTQQAKYTIAVKLEDRFGGKEWQYSSHNDVFDKSDGTGQDLLYKFTLPSNLRNSVLAQLLEMNINAFTLFSHEESLMEALAFKEITYPRIGE